MFELTKEQKRISNANHKKAAEFFKLQKGWVLHHIDPSWRHNYIERYILWDPFDLVMITKRDHDRFHKLGKPNPHKGHTFSNESRAKIAKALEGNKNGCKPRTAATKEKIALANIGKKRGHWYNDGTKNIMASECPKGFVPGRIK